MYYRWKPFQTFASALSTCRANQFSLRKQTDHGFDSREKNLQKNKNDGKCIADICQFSETTAWFSHVKVNQKCKNLQQNSGGSGDKNQLRSALKPYALPDIMSSHGYKDVVFPPSQLVTQMSSHVTLQVGYTFPGRNPVLWYRGKVNADSQGRFLSSPSNTVDTPSSPNLTILQV